MPVTKTAKRALRSSGRKQKVNSQVISSLEGSIRVAERTKTAGDISQAFSFADRASKRNIIHKNKAGHIKSSLSRISTRRTQAKG